MTGTAFDRLAARYEELWSATFVGRSQREQVWRCIDPLFRRGQRVLDLGCGIGDDALHLMARGIAVDAIDASAGMVREARSRGIVARQLAIEELTGIEGRFDGAISNFGALNCVARLKPVAEELARLILPGGALAMCVMGRGCAWEMAHYFPSRKAFRRFRGAGWQPAAGLPHIDIYYPTIRQMARAFAPHFRFVRFTGIGLFVPPSYINGFSRAAVTRFAALDRQFAHLPILRALADHRLLIFRRV